MSREVAVGGQQIAIRGLGGDYADLFLPLHGAHQAQNAAVAVGGGRGVPRWGRAALDIDVVRAGLAGATSPGRLEIVRRSPTVLVDAAHNPAGALALQDGARGLVHLRPARRCHRDPEGQGRHRDARDPRAGARRGRRDPHHVAAGDATPTRLGELAAEIFGEDRVTVVDDLPDALDRAAGLADEGGVGGGVLATGSVTTAAEVRMLLGVTNG